MDRITNAIAHFAEELNAAALGYDELHQAKRHLVDSLGCMASGTDAEPAVIARSIASEEDGYFAASVVGLPARTTTVQNAVFANTVMVRHLDLDDTYLGSHDDHSYPSELIPTALAVGEATGASGRETAMLVLLGSELLSRLRSTVRLRDQSWDQSLHTELAAAMVTGKALGLSSAQLANAAAISIVPHVPLRMTRACGLSMWKGCAAAEAARNGVWAARLADRGLTGPGQVFEDADCVFDRASGVFELELSARPADYEISQMQTKNRPTEDGCQKLVDLAVEVCANVDVATIKSIKVDTPGLACCRKGSGSAMRDPCTHEVAGHGITSRLAQALVEGNTCFGSLTRDRMFNQAVRQLVPKIRMRENENYTARWPAELTLKLTVETTNGEVVEREASFPHRHACNDLIDAEIDARFDERIAERSSADRNVALCARMALWDLENITDIGDVMRDLRELGARRTERA